MDGEIVTPGQSPDARSSVGVKHILVVDDDPTCLAIVAGMLRTWNYDVLTVNHPSDALATLRVNQGLIDLVVTDVHMPDMNGFELQKHVDEEFQLPVVMMSVDDRENVMVKGLEEGAAFFMVKPISADDLKNIWQYAVDRKKDKSTIVVEKSSSVRTSPLAKKMPYYEDIGSTSSVNEVSKEVTPKKKNYKRKTPNKPKVKWTTSLHNRFLFAINQIGLEKSVPKKIVEYMNVPGLTRENVASHLQKYRIALRRVVDTSNEANRNLCERNLLRSSFAPVRSSLILNCYQQNYSQFSEQQTKRVCQPGFGGKNGPPYKAFNNGILLSCLNQEDSKTNSITPIKDDQKSHSSLNKIPSKFQPQNYLVQASSSCGLKSPNSIWTGDVSSGIISVGSSCNLMANATNSLKTSINGLEVHQNQDQGSRPGIMTNIGTNGLMSSTTARGKQEEAQARQEVFTKGSFSYNFTENGLGNQNYISGIENLGSYDDIRSNLNKMMYPYTNKYVDTQMTNYGGKFSGYGDQMETYVGEASNGFSGGYFSNIVQQESALMQSPPQTIQESLENDGTDSGKLFGSMGNSSTFTSNSPQPFTEAALNDILLQQINHLSLNQILVLDEDCKGGGQKGIKPDFSISSYNVEPPQQIVQPLDKQEGGDYEQMTSRQKFSDDMYEADSILSWFDPQPNQQVGEEFMNSELYGMNQTSDDEMIDSLFGNSA